jgi:gentisate 1,2-dioxygenase
MNVGCDSTHAVQRAPRGCTLNDPKMMSYEHVDDLASLVRQLSDDSCTPGWIRRAKPLLWSRAQSEFTPAHWSYAKLRPALLAACRLIDTEQAERRNLVLRNPVPGNDFATTRTLVGAYQAILPGEHARSHRHAPHALRVILEARGAYSVVNGVRHPMETGDIVLTPGQHWHGHGHDGSEPALWFDCLDVPLVHLLEPMRFEDHPEGWAPVEHRAETSPMRIRHADVQEQLLRVRAAGGASPYFGLTADFSSTLMPTIGIQAHEWPTGWRNRPYSHHANSIQVVLAGTGTSRIGSHEFEWGFGDVLALPLGAAIQHEVHETACVVTLSDEPVMRFCGYYHLSDLQEAP